MLRQPKVLFALVIGTVLCIAAMGIFVQTSSANVDAAGVHKVIVPEADRFTAFAITIHRGETVKWINKDTDDHTIVSDDFVNTAGNNGTDQLLIGTDANGGKPGKFELTFTQAGTFVYYCRFHSTLDAFHQPIAPGPDGGVEGTPMMGVVTVLP